ncbi:MAG: carbonic anhydrase [Gemmatimonadales bacterium]|nr:MAG: carbonic anhydrase [Gemmatimonadales bacterium]
MAEKAALTRQVEELVLEAVRRGASMADIAALRDPDICNPDDAVEALQRGNERFFSGKARRPEASANERRAQIMSQTPFAVVLACSDSRVPVEVVFDQGLGDLFIVRVAGHVVESATLGSIEYAIAHLKCQLLVVMGHEGCGAVKAAMLPEDEVAGEPEHVRDLLGRVRPALVNMPQIRDNKARMREAVLHNVRLQVARVGENPTVRGAVDQQKMRVIGAYYEIGSGAVEFLITDEDLALEPGGDPPPVPRGR